MLGEVLRIEARIRHLHSQHEHQRSNKRRWNGGHVKIISFAEGVLEKCYSHSLTISNLPRAGIRAVLIRQPLSVLVAKLGDGRRALAVRNLQGLVPLHVVDVVKGENRSVCLLRRPVGDKSASSAAHALLVAEDVDVEDASVVLKELAHVVFVGIKMQLTNEKFRFSCWHRRIDKNLVLSS